MEARNTSPNFSLSLKINLLLIGAQLIQAQQVITAALLTCEAFNPADNTWYQFAYSSDNPFPQLPNRISDDCKMIIGKPAEPKQYHSTFTVECTWDNEPDGPVTDILIENGKNMTRSFMACTDSVLKKICDIYNKNHHPSSDLSSIEKIVIGLFSAISIISIFTVFVCFACRKDKEDVTEEENGRINSNNYVSQNNPSNYVYNSFLSNGIRYGYKSDPSPNPRSGTLWTEIKNK